MPRLCAPFLMPPLGDHSDTSVTCFPLYKKSRNKYGCTAIMKHFKKCVYSDQKIPWGKKNMASRVTITGDKGKTEGSIWPFTYTFQLRNYCKIHVKEVLQI